MSNKNIFIGTALWILILPILIIFCLPFAIWRICVNQLVKYLRPDLIPITNTIDQTVSIYPSSAFALNNVSQVWKLRGHLDVSRFRKHFYETFLSTNELRVKYRNLYCHFVRWMAYGFKKPVDTIDLEDRIREHKLKDKESIEEFIGDWMSVNDYGDRPNWEILIIHLENNGNEFNEESCESVLLFKIDHGLCDGYSLVHLTEKLTGIKSPYIVKNEKRSSWTEIKLILMFPKVFIDLILRMVHSQDPLKRYAVANNSSKWMVSFTTLDLQRIKMVRKKTNAHFNTILGILQVGAMRRYLLETGRVSSAYELPELDWIVSPEGWPEHPAMIPGGGGMTNHSTTNLWRNPLRLEDPLERLLAAEEEFLFHKGTGFHKTSIWILFPMHWVTPNSIVAWTVKNTAVKLPLSHILSPLMCSCSRYQLMGHQVDHLYVSVHMPKNYPFTQMMVVPVTNSGRVDVCLTANSKLISSKEELDLFTKFYKEELDRLVYSCELKYKEVYTF